MEDPGKYLGKLLTGRVCIVGVGNRLRGDDGAGPRLIELLDGRVAAICIDAGSAPENHLERIVQAAPDMVLVVDAVDFGGRAGEIRIMELDEIGGGAISTHALSLGMMREYLGQRINAGIHLLAVQPFSVGLNASVTAEVQNAVEFLAEALSSCLPRV
ncbi:MAG: hydrogenase 3 maturation endopeptidase HyCI [Kiritimatiellae bacterium]|nr:hydrogenase 3 maturation endopeptidase HyCI [Kiritimatiellia bacterium]